MVYNVMNKFMYKIHIFMYNVKFNKCVLKLQPNFFAQWSNYVNITNYYHDNKYQYYVAPANSQQ